ncbi:site-specific DNA-methyltransferase [Lonepinella sp. MS14436]|uniref:site-specific DNA-methyltransferase n=1 Tax=Lonepinella sp. MS14436 TaxID=3003619 RepID=UPI0036DB316C
MLNWAGKSEAYHTLQSPSFKTLTPCPQESVDFDHSDNIFIEGENLDVLKILQKSYFNSVKMIYIDPPYNTGNDFVYHDNFASRLDDYQQQSGEKDENGLLKKAFVRNSKENGHYHSNWLNMMLPRLHLAKNLLKDDGVIFISIDDNEQAQLKLLCDEVFGEENFVGQFIWKSRQNKDNRNLTGLSIDHEYIFCYSKYNNQRILNGAERKVEQYKNPDNDPRGLWVSANMVGLLGEDQRPNCHYDLINPNTGINYGKPKLGWRYDKNTMSKLIEENRILFPKEPSGRPRRKVFLNELNSELPNINSIIGENIYTTNGTKDINELFDNKFFPFPKPVKLIEELLKQTTKQENDIILDFFAGSATTAHAVMQLNAEDNSNRRFICVQMPELTDEKSEAFKAGFKTIAEISKERIRRAGKHIAENNPNPLDTGFKVFKLSDSYFKQWQSPNVEDLAKQLEFFIDPVADFAEPQAMLYEILLRLGLKLSVKVRLENTIFWLEDENSKRYAILLSEANEALFNQIIEQQPLKVVMLDRLFNGNDALKKNTELQFADHHIQFLVI